MILLSKSIIIKNRQTADEILNYDFARSFEEPAAKEEPEEVEEKEEVEPEETGEEFFQTVDIFEDAIKQAEEIIAKAREEAQRIQEEARESGHQEGYDAGFEEGHRKAYEDYKAELDAKQEAFKKEVKATIEDVTAQKDAIMEKYIDDLKKITLTIAEKVIQTSLKSSGEVIKRMIVAAAGKLKKTQWVKIYVSQNDAGMMIQGDVGLLNELSHLSGNIKIIAMEHAEDGTCIIELPEEIIDVSVNTQLENIKGILNNARL